MVEASGTSSPSTVADRSTLTKSPIWAGRGTPVRVPKRARNESSCSETSASSTTIGSTVTASSPKAGTMISGRTSTSAVKVSSSPSSSLVTSISGWPSTLSSALLIASEYLAGIAALTTCSSTAPRPTRASSRRAGALPGRKPGRRICCANALYARSKSGFSSANGTSTTTRTRVGLSCSTVLFTVLLCNFAVGGLAHGRDAYALCYVPCRRRGGGIRTHGPSLPKRVRYQAALHPVARIVRGGCVVSVTAGGSPHDPGPPPSAGVAQW